MNKTELMTQIQAERAKLEALLSKLSAEQMTQPDVMGTWSVKDILAHLTTWQARAITLMFALERKAKPNYPQPGRNPADPWASINAKDYAEQKDRPLDEVLADFRGAQIQLLKRLTGWQDEAMLFDAKKFNVRGESLGQLILGSSAEHDAEHGAMIKQKFNL